MINIKNIIRILVFSIFIFVLFSINAFAFKDISETDWFYDDIQKAVDYGYIDGYEDELFLPNKEITYGEFCKILAQIHNAEIDLNKQYNHWSEPYAKFLRSQGNSDISTYKGDLDNPITRKDAIRNLLYSFGVRNVVGSKYYKNIPFWDMPISTVLNYDGYILIANRLGIVYGDSNGNINPNNYLSRAEAISIINRAIKVENWEIPAPDIINGLEIEYRGDGTQGFIENICRAISKYPEAVVNKFSEDGWKIVINDEDYGNYYDSLKNVGGLYSQKEKNTLYIYSW